MLRLPDWLAPHVVCVKPLEIMSRIASTVVPALATVLASFPKLGSSVAWLLTGTLREGSTFARLLVPVNLDSPPSVR